MTKKRNNAIGCFLYLAFIIPPFFFLPMGAAIGFAFICTFIMFLIAEISRQLGNLKKRRQTNKSPISASSEGFVELVAKVKSNSTQQTWLEELPADYHEIDVFQWKPGTSSNKGHWTRLYRKRSHDRYFAINDDSGDCYVSLHHHTLHAKLIRKE